MSCFPSLGDPPCGECYRCEPDAPCPPCDKGHQHEYDDDWPFSVEDVRDLAPGSRLGDPCVWCMHSKCRDCPGPRPVLTVVKP